MRIKVSEHRLTRIVIDGVQSVELADLPLVMQRIHHELRRQVPLAPHRPIDSALLGLAAHRCLLDAGDATPGERALSSTARRFEEE